ncbi:MAG TPA: DUF6101 family protein [Rhizobiaceae bacterium]|nr:DUF6101 family protein [Rhizobiaceae bacterium]
MISTGLKPVWAGHHMRLDPFRLPQKVCFAAKDSRGEVDITVDARGAVIKRVLPMSGLPLAMALPRNVFRGVCARAMEEEDGEVTVTLELLHADPDLSVPLLVAHDLDDIAADWRAWCDIMKLPMMLVERDGMARALDDMVGQVRAGETMPRRRHSFFADRRPRFLARRRMGDLGLRMVIDGEEIISRD